MWLEARARRDLLALRRGPRHDPLRIKAPMLAVLHDELAID